MTYWFSKKISANGYYHSKSIGLHFRLQHFFKFHWGDDGAQKGNPNHTCYDFNVHAFGIFFSYTNWNYNS